MAPGLPGAIFLPKILQRKFWVFREFSTQILFYQNLGFNIDNYNVIIYHILTNHI